MKNGVFANYKIFAANSHPELAEEISSIIGKPLGEAKVSKFSDGEISVGLEKPSEAVTVSSSSPPVIR